MPRIPAIVRKIDQRLRRKLKSYKQPTELSNSDRLSKSDKHHYDCDKFIDNYALLCSEMDDAVMRNILECNHTV